jgi:hypothetical protein
MKKMLMMILVLATTTAFAASTGTIFLSGTIAPINDLQITPLAAATNLNVISGENNRLVATVTETSNSLNGYKILMRSLNASKLVNTVNSAYKAAYTVSYDGGSPMSLSTSDQEVKNSGSLNGLTTDNSDVKVNVTAYPTGPAGTYSDTITVSIVAN